MNEAAKLRLCYCCRIRLHKYNVMNGYDVTAASVQAVGYILSGLLKTPSDLAEFYVTFFTSFTYFFRRA